MSAGQHREFYGGRGGLLSRSGAGQAFDTSGKRLLSQPVLLQIQLRSFRLHPLVLALLKAGAMAHGGISVMDSAEAEVMERPSAKMANWYCMLETRVCYKEQKQGGFIRKL